MRRILGLVLVAGIIGVSSFAAAGVDGKPGPGVISSTTSKIEWTGTKTGGKHDGGFKTFSGKLDPVAGDVTASTITVDIDTSSLYSDNGKLTQHLKSPDFFGVDAFPKAGFVSTKIEAAAEGSNTHKITGDLTLHGVKKEISFPAKIVETGDKISLTSTFSIDRTDFGMNFGKGKVNDAVTIKLNAEISRK